SGTEGTDNVAMATAGGSTVTFNGLGRVTGAAITRIDFSYPSGGTCEDAGGTIRCMAIVVSSGGSLKMCDPKITAAGDARNCSV
ncbi:MAG TPA: hypothetical protein VJK49_02305, partial [Candidatus Limnocylindrales bacterium]|nr:hypothetical protein [Candidatus Limnocylindrales bacterium]